MPKQKKPTKRQLAEFRSRVEQILTEAGATKGTLYEWQIESPLGLWEISVYDDWIATRFVDVDRAVKFFGRGQINEFTGKMNWHYTTTASREQADLWGKQFRQILAKQNPARKAGKSQWMLVHLASAENPDYEETSEWMGGYPQGTLPSPEKWIRVNSLSQASWWVQQYIYQYRLGVGNWAGGEVIDEKTKQPVASVSYNGRVWPPGRWKSGMKPLQEPSKFDPAARNPKGEEPRTVAALFVAKNGIYFGVPGVDPWDETRDARKYAGPHPVVAHPPCGPWGKYAKALGKFGQDDGMFQSALNSVRTYGGVLEHPEGSGAWREFGLLAPERGAGWVHAGDFIGWTCYVEQGHYGHRGRKGTWLYAAHVKLPDLQWGKSVSKITPRPGRDLKKEIKRGAIERMSKRERAATPLDFRDLLIGIARTASVPRKNPREPAVTNVNLYTLYTTVKEQGEIISKVPAVSVAGLKRCLRFGLLEQVPGTNTVRLTDLGRAKLTEYEQRLPPHMQAGLFGAANQNPARSPAAAKLLQHKFDPDHLAPGIYETSSGSEAYPAARFLVESGRARVVSEQFLPGGRVLLTVEKTNGRAKSNPDEEERTVEVKMSRKWLESRTKQYRDWRTAWWREAIQNSIDPGTGAATRVDLRCEQMADGNWLVSCSDNGNGMTREQVEDPDKGFLVFGGSGKTASSSSIGGFGEAKELLVFPWIQYRLLTSDQEYTGRGNQAKAKKAPMRKGVLLEVIMPADVHTTPEDALLVLARSWIPNVTFTLNGKTIKTGIPTPSKKLDEVAGQGIVYETPRRRKTAEAIELEKQREPDKEPDKRDPADILVRKDGLWMFTERLHGSAKHGLIVEVTGPSTKIFTANRDGFESGAWDLREAIDKAKEEMASEGEVRSKLEKPEELTIRGPMFNAAQRALTVREAVGPLPETKAGKPIHLNDETINQIVQVVASFTAQDLANLPHDQQGHYDEESEERLMQAVMASPEASKVIMQTADLKGQTSFDAAVRQVVWQPAFHYRKDEGLKYRIPAKFKPAGMTPAVLRLLKTWAELCRMALVNIGSDLTYGVGFWFSQQAGAGYLRKDNTNWLLLDPHKSKEDRTEIYNPANLEDLKWLWSTAQHEVAHMLVFKKTGYSESDRPASHGSDYAYALSMLNQQLADAWPKVKKLAASIHLRGQIKRPDKPKQPKREKLSSEQIVAEWPVEKIARGVGSFVGLYHRKIANSLVSNWSDKQYREAALAYVRMMKGLTAGAYAVKNLDVVKPYLQALSHSYSIYDKPIWLKIHPSMGFGYEVNVALDCGYNWDAACQKLDDKLAVDVREFVTDARLNRDPLFEHVYHFRRRSFEGWMYEHAPEPASNPCGRCGGKENPPRQQNLRERYRYFEAEAQKSAAQGKRLAAKQYKMQAGRMLEQARAAREPWATSRGNPAARTGEMVKVMLPSGNLGVYRTTTSHAASAEDIMRYQEHVATHFPGPDGISRWYMLRGPQGVAAASEVEAARFDRLPTLGASNPAAGGDLLLPPARTR